MDTTTQWVLVIIFWIVFAIVAHYRKRRNDMRLMAQILKRREGREEKWTRDLEMYYRMGNEPCPDVREMHKETLASEERFIEYFKEKYGAEK
jgi:hypothetical protein